MKRPLNLKKRYITLLEVLIAFVLIVLCILPLIYPHVAIYKSQNRLVKQIELDHAVNLLYAKILEKLYLNSIRWGDIESRVFSIDEPMLKEAGFNHSLHYIGSYNFFEEKPLFKPKKKGAPLSVHLLTLTFNFLPKEYENATDEIKKDKTLKYKYEVFVARDLRANP